MRPADLGIVLFVMLLWGLNFVVAKVGLQYMPPIFFVALRFLLVALLLVAFVPIPRGRLKDIFALSVVLGSLHFTLMFNAMKALDAGTASVVIQLQVPFAALLAAFVFKDKLGWRSIAGMVLAFAGVLLIAGEPRLSGNLPYIGLVVAAAFFFAIANIQMKKLGDVDANTINAWTAVFATPQLFLISAVLEHGQLDALRQVDWPFLGSLFYQAVIMVIVSYAMWYGLLRRYPVGQVVPFMLLLPVLGVLTGAVFLAEPITWHTVVGGLLTIAGVAVIVLRRARVTEPRVGSVT
ncbi:MAG: EamA family transporter [Rhodospirillales bacterium]